MTSQTLTGYQTVWIARRLSDKNDANFQTLGKANESWSYYIMLQWNYKGKLQSGLGNKHLFHGLGFSAYIITQVDCSSWTHWINKMN